MAFKSFRSGVVLRVLLLTAGIMLLCLVYDVPRYRFSMILLGLLVVVQVVELIRYAEKTNRRLTLFLNSIRFSDFSISFSDHKLGESFSELSAAFNAVIGEFHRTRAEKEEHFNYLQTVVQHVNTGILTFRRDGHIDLYNNTVKRLLRLSSLRTVGDLARVKPELPDILMRMRSGDRHLIRIYLENEMMQVLLYATEFRLRDEEYVLVGLQNIHSELEEKEIESWQNLIRVLTHEIMNSMTPISSLASTVKGMLVDEESGTLAVIDQEDEVSVCNALETIQSRSQSLLNFVEVYRNLTRIPKPNFRYFPLKELLERAQQLLSPRFQELGIATSCRVIPEGLKLTADPDLVDQVIINLLLNAIDAVREKQEPQVGIRAYARDDGKVVIEVSDNGQGITPDILDKIFMPFFTSKKHGSGIGLSLSRQIMSLHKGNISVRSVPGEGSVFTLVF
ncbi:MAG TPA: ATP-binding protein [Bacteroidales bacterium]|nr:ATP-binding protein [Bacteroidales bacterium]